MFKLKLFFITFVATACVLLSIIYVHRARYAANPKLNPLTDGLFVTSQLKPEDMPALKLQGFKNIVDLRPDGEADDQAPSLAIKQAAEENGLAFHYIPVPHGDIPKDAVDALHRVLADQTAQTVLYCRTGNRAVRTFALVEASRADGPSADAILRMTRDAGFAADDLKDDINQRIARRQRPEEARK